MWREFLRVQCNVCNTYLNVNLNLDFRHVLAGACTDDPMPLQAKTHDLLKKLHLSCVHHIPVVVHILDYTLKNTYKFHFDNKVAGRIFLRINFFIDTAQPTSQHLINIVSTLWMTAEIMLIWHWEWSKIQSQIFNVRQHWYNVSVQHWNNVKSTLHNADATSFQCCTTSFQHCFNIDVTSSQCCFSMGSASVKAILASQKYEFAERLISFILLNKKIFFTIY